MLSSWPLSWHVDVQYRCSRLLTAYFCWNWVRIDDPPLMIFFWPYLSSFWTSEAIYGFIHCYRSSCRGWRYVSWGWQLYLQFCIRASDSLVWIEWWITRFELWADKWDNLVFLLRNRLPHLLDFCTAHVISC